MMKNLILKGFLIVSLIMFGLSSCNKDDNNDSPSQTTTPTYELRFTCTSNNTYLIEVNGNSDVIPGNSYKTYTFDKGTYSWKVTQQSGYALYPTVKEGTVNLDQDKEIVFP